MVPVPINMEFEWAERLSSGYRRRDALLGSVASTSHSVRLPYQTPGKLASPGDRSGGINIESRI